VCGGNEGRREVSWRVRSLVSIIETGVFGVPPGSFFTRSATLMTGHFALTHYGNDNRPPRIFSTVAYMFTTGRLFSRDGVTWAIATGRLNATAGECVVVINGGIMLMVLIKLNGQLYTVPVGLPALSSTLPRLVGVWPKEESGGARTAVRK
jgi:hypothetical protein